jgi:hypothetical protein
MISRRDCFVGQRALPPCAPARVCVRRRRFDRRRPVGSEIARVIRWWLCTASRIAPRGYHAPWPPACGGRLAVRRRLSPCNLPPRLGRWCSRRWGTRRSPCTRAGMACPSRWCCTPCPSQRWRSGGRTAPSWTPASRAVFRCRACRARRPGSGTAPSVAKSSRGWTTTACGSTRASARCAQRASGGRGGGGGACVPLRGLTALPLEVWLTPVSNSCTLPPLPHPGSHD